MHYFRGFISFFILASSASPSQLMAQYDNHPGGIIDLEIAKQSTNLPDVKYGTKDVTVLDQGTSWRVLVGIDLTTIPGEYLLYIKRQSEDSNAYSEKFEVGHKIARFINSATDTQVSALYHDIFSDISFNNTNQPALPLSYPASGQWADYFGHINTNPLTDNVDARNFISLTTTEVIPVTSPQDAIVSHIIESDPNEYNNKKNCILFLDHGRGLYSVLSGVTDLTIKVGNGVQAGAVLGKVYSDSNTNSQPRTLIWQTVLNGAYVNPIILTKL